MVSCLHVYLIEYGLRPLYFRTLHYNLELCIMFSNVFKLYISLQRLPGPREVMSYIWWGSKYNVKHAPTQTELSFTCPQTYWVMIYLSPNRLSYDLPVLKQTHAPGRYHVNVRSLQGKVVPVEVHNVESPVVSVYPVQMVCVLVDRHGCRLHDLVPFWFWRIMLCYCFS